MQTSGLWMFGAGPLVHPSAPHWKARQGLTYKSFFQPGQEHAEHPGEEHPHPEFLLQVSRLLLTQERTEHLSSPSSSHLPFASIFCDAPNTSVLHWCHVPRPGCSDELPDTLPLLRWEGAKVLFAALLDSFPANILSVAGLFEYPGKSSANCRLARRIPKKQFYQNFWQRKCPV